MSESAVISPLKAKIILKFAELGDELEALLEAEDKYKAYEKFELTLTLNDEERLRIFEEGVQVDLIR